MKRSSPLRVRVAVTIAALALAGCASDTTDSDTPGVDTGDATETAGISPGFFGRTDDPGDPVDGGSFTFGYGGGIASFDPATQQYAGSSGGSEALAVYGALAQYDTEAGEYTASMAESIEPNDDFSEWTVELRDGVTFTDGTPYDAEAVKFNFDRLAASGAGFSRLWTGLVSGVEVEDPSTVVISLTQPWADFPYLISQAPGFIASPAAVLAEGENYLRAPVGAGPFMLESWTPGEQLELAANPEYWDGEPYLDTLKFQTITSGDQALYDALQAGGIQGSFLTTPTIVEELAAEDSGFAGIIRTTNTGAVVLINNGTPNRPDAPGKDLNVRKAVAAAIDPEVIDERAFDGEGLPGTELFQSISEWANDEPGLTYDTAAAEGYLAEAKADGFDGSIELLYLAASPETALTVQAQLEAVGFIVETKPVQAITDIISSVLINRDYQLAMYGWPVPDEPGELYTSYMERFGREDNQLGYYNEAVNAALKDFAATADRDEKAEAMATVQREWAETVPAVPLNASAQMAVWDDNVHGIDVSARLELDFSNAWIGE